nr:unnamed protein product [Digitaria exilis]
MVQALIPQPRAGPQPNKERPVRPLRTAPAVVHPPLLLVRRRLPCCDAAPGSQDVPLRARSPRRCLVRPGGPDVPGGSTSPSTLSVPGSRLVFSRDAVLVACRVQVPLQFEGLGYCKSCSRLAPDLGVPGILKMDVIGVGAVPGGRNGVVLHLDAFGAVKLAVECELCAFVLQGLVVWPARRGIVPAGGGNAGNRRETAEEKTRCLDRWSGTLLWTEMGQSACFCGLRGKSEGGALLFAVP